ncbi:ubiquitin-binding protein Ecym_5516 [Eremothecium cymbalariae DBVPG|uniref:VHS domain-containing protein n=1 Tax=Eremothecium cymbalariae (strain CBS 270.75 / DBVPG 7215 / KCTC 17166 / NRRL Y-17582) TaxID=931890 RepID=I6NDW6_ERECY|nr:hypothetical protein Ecym_5516 [Eremothecium cymbalariae DBVPG\
MSSSGIYLSEAPVRRTGGSGNALLRKIQRACRLSLVEPDLSLNLDVADYINAKQGGAPRDAVLTIVKLINSRGIHTAVFALSLLDVLVKNCGYPIHLQISRKEFLNELVKRFPEKPPMRYTKVQRLILTAIEEWYQTICKNSSYKEDMKYIRDMHSLLKYKGYVFPKINQEDLAVLRPSDHLKTPSELQKEQEIAQAAKLEELIRRGKPEDLREANKLMKVMAGYKEDNIVNVTQTLTDELTKLKRKADLFNEMLSALDTAEVEDGAIVELYSSLKSSQPKFQKIIEEKQGDEEFVQDLLQFNVKVNQLIQKYQLLRTGHASDAHKLEIPVSTTSPAGSTTLANEINLIDFDDNDNDDIQGSGGGDGGLDDLLGDLLGMKVSPPSQGYGIGGSISLGSSQIAQPIETAKNHNSIDLLAELSSSHHPSPPTSESFTPSRDVDLLDGFKSSTSSSNGRLLVNSSSNLSLEFEVTRVNSSAIKMFSYFSSRSIFPIEDLTFLVAVPKTCNLKLLPQSGNTIASGSVDGVTQEGLIENAPVDASKPLKIKWKLTYTLDGKSIEESSVYTLPKV